MLWLLKSLPFDGWVPVDVFCCQLWPAMAVGMNCENIKVTIALHETIVFCLLIWNWTAFQTSDVQNHISRICFVSNAGTYLVYIDWRVDFVRFPPPEHVGNAHGCHSTSRDTSHPRPRPVVWSYVSVSLTPATDPDQWGRQCALENEWTFNSQKSKPWKRT